MVHIPTGRQLIDPFKVLEAGGIRGGMSVADFGCGTLGHYVFPAAGMVGNEGKVYAVDILKSVLNSIESRAKTEGATNVETVWGDLERDNGVKIASDSVDLGLLVNNLFLSKQKEEMMRECVRTVKPGGKFVIADWKTTGASFGPDPAVRVGPDEAKALAAGVGLKLEKEFEPGEYHYGLVFTK